MDIFLIFSQNINRSNLSKQAFLSIFQNEYVIEEIISLLNHYHDNESIEHEAHISLITEILFSVFCEENSITDVIVLLYGSTFYEILSNIRIKLQSDYDTSEIDPVSKDFFPKLDALINLLAPVKVFNENREIKALMNYINDCCFNNVQKYNLNEKSINEDNLKDENIKEYVKGLKMNITNYVNSDIDFLDNCTKKSSLINELFVAVKLVNLSVTYLTIPKDFISPINSIFSYRTIYPFLLNI